jgi:alkyldihydroxyacetonephosphate synthase
MTIDRKRIRWNGWGWADHEDHLSGNAAVWAWMADVLGLGGLMATPATPLEDIELPPLRLPAATLDALRAIAGADNVRIDDYERAFHARGRSYHDLLILRAGRIDAAPDAIIYPENEAQVVELLRFADEHALAVIPYGGGSSVVGGVNPATGPGQQGVLTLDMTLMNRIRAIDEVSLTATVEPGIYGPDLERQLQERGFTLGHYPQSFEFSTLGGWVAARGAGQQSNRYGKAEKWLVSARLATPAGTWTTEGFPASAAGPALGTLVPGSEGRLGVITEATVKLHRAPAVKDYRGYLFKDFDSGQAAVRALAQSDLPLAMVRLSDEDETRFFQAFSSLGAQKTIGTRIKSAIQSAVLSSKGLGKDFCLMLVGIEGEAEDVAYAAARSRAIIKAHGGFHVGRSPGRKWYEGRFNSPYARDPMMDHGLGVDTLETATRWSNIPTLYKAVRKALLDSMAAEATSPGARGIVMTHISHSYPDGASLYFTFVFPRDLGREVEQWQAIKNAASEAIAAHGGTISHHHGVGTDHAPWLGAEKGEHGMALLRTAAQTVDPKGVMNPGKLFGA